MSCVTDTLCYTVYTVTVLEFASGRVDRKIKIDPLNMFMNISKGSDILGKGSNQPDLSLVKYSNTALNNINIVRFTFL